MLRIMLSALLAVLVLGATARAATFRGVPVEQLASRSEAVAVVRILDRGVSFIGERGQPATRWTSEVLRSDRGPLQRGDAIHLVERGGEVGGRGLIVSGIPRYRQGETLLLFLTRRHDGSWRAQDHEMGVFRSSRRGWVRERAGIGRSSPLEDSRTLEALGIGEWLLTGEEGDVSAPVRHQRFELRDRFTLHVSGSAARFPAARRYVELAMKAWNDDPASHVHLSRGDDVEAPYDVEDGVSAVVLDATIPDSDSNVVGQTSIFYRTTVTPGREPYFIIHEADVAMRGGLIPSPKIYAEILTHELGHALGFRHSNDGVPSSSDAVMNSEISGRFGPTLGEWDREALAAVYPPLIPSCRTPQITVTGHEGQHPTNADVVLEAHATGDGELLISWYRGLPGDRSEPLGSGPTITLENVTRSLAFWVLVAGECGFVETPVLELIVEFCDAASLVTVQYPSSVSRGATATLTAIGGGETPLEYEWFDSDPASGAAPIADGATFTTPPVLAAVQYWVRVSNRCGAAVSEPLTIDIRTSRRRGVRPPGH